MGKSIAIDGPAGVGKSTIAKELSEELSFIYVDTGAIYRALSVYLAKKGVPAEDGETIARVLPEVEISVRYLEGEQHVFANGEDVTGLLRTEAISKMTSVCSQYAAVRAKLLSIQRELAESSDVIMDGRDIGTVVLPDATLKIFLTARPKVRALRRYRQLTETGKLGNETVESIEKEIEERDYRDSHRANAPLQMAPDAVLVDTSDMSIREVKERICLLLAERVQG